MRGALEIVVFSGLVAVGGWIAGCSSATDDPQEPPAAGTLLPSTPGPSGAGGGAGTTASTATSAKGPGGGVAACVAACEDEHPAGARLGQAIDTCWAKSCDACQGANAGGALEGPTSGSCKTEVATPSAACSTCTARSCCAAWDACFSNADCVALNACSVACYR